MTEQPPQSFFDHLHDVGKMRPKWFFMVEHILMGLAIVLVAVGLVFLGSLVGYFWHSAHIGDVPSFGPGSYGVVAQAFPWWEVIVVLLGAAAFIFLLQRHTKLYRWPLTATIGVFVLAFALASWAAATTPFHSAIENRVSNGGFRFAAPLYRAGRHVEGLITPGTITKISGKQWHIMTPDQQDVTVTITSSTRLDGNWTPVVGDRVIVFGQRDDTKITASAIRQANQFPHRQPFFLNRAPGETEFPPAT